MKQKIDHLWIALVTAGPELFELAYHMHMSILNDALISSLSND